MPMVLLSKISDKGRVQIPEQVRKALLLQDGEYLAWHEKGPYHYEVRRASIKVEEFPRAP